MIKKISCYGWLSILKTFQSSVLPPVLFSQGFFIWVGVDLLSGEGNGTPLQYSCLENPTDGRAW